MLKTDTAAKVFDVFNVVLYDDSAAILNSVVLQRMDLDLLLLLPSAKRMNLLNYYSVYLLQFAATTSLRKPIQRIVERLYLLLKGPVGCSG